jgi:single-stranded DNA-binding protein
MLNQVILIGRVVRCTPVDPLLYDGTIVDHLVIQVDRAFKDDSGLGQKDEITIVLSQNLKLSFTPYLLPGNVVAIKGSLQTVRSRFDLTQVVVIAERLTFVSPSLELTPKTKVK